VDAMKEDGHVALAASAVTDAAAAIVSRFTSCCNQLALVLQIATTLYK